MINVKDLLIYDDKEHFNARNVLRSVLFTHEHKKTSDLLFEMRKSSTNMAIVLDEYGVTAGMVTIEDLLEEIVGDIRDEYDEDEEQLVTRLSDQEYIVAGAMNLDDLNDALDLEEKDFLWNPKITTPSAVLLLNFLTVSLKSVMKSLQKTASASWLILWKRTGSKMSYLSAGSAYC